MHFVTDDVKGRLAVEVVYFECSREVHQLRRMDDGDQGQVALSPHLLKMRQDAQGMWLYLEIKPRSTSIDKAVSRLANLSSQRGCADSVSLSA